MKVLLFGASGQVGREFVQGWQRHPGEIQLTAPTRSQVDLSRPDQIRNLIHALHPQVVINAAAYTAVDQAESDPDTALTINATAPAAIAEACRQIDARLIHYSTDYVFDGSKRSPYVETDAVAPLNVYGQTKLKGDHGIMASGARHVILRVGWVYSPFGKNFFLNMLKRAYSGTTLRIVNDQFGVPTSADAIAAVTTQLLDFPEVEGLYHYAPLGQCSWFEFAQQIMQTAGVHASIVPIVTSEYPTPARRPVYSIMSSVKLRRTLPIVDETWQEQLERNVSRLPASVQA